MHIVVKANPQQKEAFLLKLIPATMQVSFIEDDFIEGDVYFDLQFEDKGAAFAAITHKPVFVNAVLASSNQLASNYIRINAWNGFLENDIIEIAATQQEQATTILNTLGWKFLVAPNEPGMIAPRIIAMIINEAYFALGDKVSTKEEIDIAMKLGTNYPYGPFEWSEKIGLYKIYQLLRELSVTDERYLPSPELEQELKSIA
jgi:3-hydroxybutyryl-CoA dehydrogenase